MIEPSIQDETIHLQDQDADQDEYELDQVSS